MAPITGYWEIEYIDGDDMLRIIEHFEAPEINDSLNSEPQATFTIPNTDQNRYFIQNDQSINIYYNGYLMFSGVLKAADIGATKIKCYVYDAVFCVLDEAEPITGVYDAVPANQIMLDVIEDTDVEVDECPSTEVTVVLYKANRLDVVKFLADALGLDYYTSNGQYINIAFRTDETWSLQSNEVSISKRALDRTKYAQKVIIRGIDLFGRHITGEAGSGTPVRVFNEDTPANQDALENSAAKKLAELSTDSAGAPISTLINLGFEFFVGDFVDIYSNKYLLSNQYRIMQLTKQKTKVKMQLDYMRKSIDKTIADLRSWENKGIYLPGCTSWSVNLQYLVGCYHLTEGSGTIATDTSPIDNPNNGNIINGHWDDSPIGGGAKVLALQGDGYVDCGSAISLATNGSCFSVGCWFSPVNLDSTPRYLAAKSGQFELKYINNVLRFTFTDSGSNVHNYDSDAGKVKAYGRHFVMVTYDGSILKMYLNAQMHKQWTLNYTLHPSTNDIYLGLLLQGNLAEMMLWNRCLADQEVTELYFFPLR